uniref:Uncharacterized protein n=1 Tax=Opuntia streptacantha TaxID=393608 RepID=A0A7C8YJB8_OPUST
MHSAFCTTKAAEMRNCHEILSTTHSSSEGYLIYSQKLLKVDKFLLFPTVIDPINKVLNLPSQLIIFTTTTFFYFLVLYLVFQSRFYFSIGWGQGCIYLNLLRSYFNRICTRLPLFFKSS